MDMPGRNVPSPELEPAALLLAPLPQVALELSSDTFLSAEQTRPGPWEG